MTAHQPPASSVPIAAFRQPTPPACPNKIVAVTIAVDARPPLSAVNGSQAGTLITRPANFMTNLTVAQCHQLPPPPDLP